jgi:ADP-heptose:LPS heptosyltransferase
MSLYRTFLNLIAAPLKLKRRVESRYHATDPRILVIRRNRMGDMIYTLPLLQALRRHFPQAHICVVCDPMGAPIAQACDAVNEVLVLEPGWNSWQAAIKNAYHLQNYDWVIAAKGGFDRRLAVLARLTNAAVRIGFERIGRSPSAYYTDPVPIPTDAPDEHQIETLLRLLKPMGLIKPTSYSGDLNLRVPEQAREFVEEILAEPPFAPHPRYMVINFSSTVPLKFREEDFIALMRRVLNATDLAMALVGAPLDQQKVQEIADCMGSKRIVAIQTPGPIKLAALLDRASVLFTPEGGAAHLAAAMGTAALVLWSEGPFKKWYSRGRNHAYVHAEPGEKVIPLERVWAALQPFLGPGKEPDEQTATGAHQAPRAPGLAP